MCVIVYDNNDEHNQATVVLRARFSTLNADRHLPQYADLTLMEACGPHTEANNGPHLTWQIWSEGPLWVMLALS